MQVDEPKIENVPEKERAYACTEIIVQGFLSWAYVEKIYVGCITYLWFMLLAFTVGFALAFSHPISVLAKAKYSALRTKA